MVVSGRIAISHQVVTKAPYCPAAVFDVNFKNSNCCMNVWTMVDKCVVGEMGKSEGWRKRDK